MKSLLPLIVGLFFLVSVFGKTLRREDKRTFVDTEVTDERERWMYRYDGTAHQLIFRERFERNTPCYVYNVNDSDRALAHTTTGMVQLQIRALGMVKQTQVPTRNVTRLGTFNRSYCRDNIGYSVIYLN